MANVLDELGLVEHHAGRHAKAESPYAEALPMMEKALAPRIGDAYLMGLLQHRAVCLRELNRQAQADSLEARARIIQAALNQQRSNEELH